MSGRRPPVSGAKRGPPCDLLASLLPSRYIPLPEPSRTPEHGGFCRWTSLQVWRRLVVELDRSLDVSVGTLEDEIDALSHASLRESSDSLFKLARRPLLSAASVTLNSSGLARLDVMHDLYKGSRLTDERCTEST